MDGRVAGCLWRSLGRSARKSCVSGFRAEAGMRDGGGGVAVRSRLFASSFFLKNLFLRLPFFDARLSRGLIFAQTV
jgi:hypothetical protein